MNGKPQPVFQPSRSLRVLLGLFVVIFAALNSFALYNNHFDKQGLDWHTLAGIVAFVSLFFGCRQLIKSAREPKAFSSATTFVMVAYVLIGFAWMGWGKSPAPLTNADTSFGFLGTMIGLALLMIVLAFLYVLRSPGDKDS